MNICSICILQRFTSVIRCGTLIKRNERDELFMEKKNKNMGSSRMACNLAGREYVDRTGDTSGVSCHCSVCPCKTGGKK